MKYTVKSICTGFRLHCPTLTKFSETNRKKYNLNGTGDKVYFNDLKQAMKMVSDFSELSNSEMETLKNSVNENMKISKSRVKEIVRETIVEENEYQAFFQKVLNQYGGKIKGMSDDEKKEFFNKIDNSWSSKGEKRGKVKEKVFAPKSSPVLEKITMNNLDWGKSTAERNSNQDKYGSLKSEKEKNDFLKKLKGGSISEKVDTSKKGVYIQQYASGDWKVSVSQGKTDFPKTFNDNFKDESQARKFADKVAKNHHTKVSVLPTAKGRVKTESNEKQSDWAEYSDIAIFTLGSKKSGKFSDEKLEKLGKKIVDDKFNGDISKAWKTIVKDKPLKERKSVNETKFVAFYNRKKYDVDGKDLWDAKKKIIAQLKIPKSKQGLLSVKSVQSQKNQDFRYEGVNESKTDDLYSKEIAGLTGTRSSAILDFITNNNIDANKLFHFITKGNLKDRMGLVNAVVGNPGNKYFKAITSKFGKVSEENKPRLREMTKAKAIKLAREITKKDRGIVQHVNKQGGGSYGIDDWYDADNTVASFVNGEWQ